MTKTALFLAAFLRLAVVRSIPEDFDAAVASVAVAGTTQDACVPVIGSLGLCVPDCHCIPDDPSDCGTCPALGKRRFPRGGEDAKFFAGLKVEEHSLFRFDPPGCNPYPIIAQVLDVPVCQGVKTTKKNGKSQKAGKGKGARQCSFRYKEPKKSKKGKGNGGTCETKRYSIVEERLGKKPKKSKSKSKSKTTAVTHEGSCGVCSSAQDLAANLSPTLDLDTYACTVSIIENPSPTWNGTFPGTVQCFKDLGFSEDCAVLWASNSLRTILNIFVGAENENCSTCAEVCQPNPSLPICSSPLAPGTCDLAPCSACDEEVSGAIFGAFAGRRRRNSGIITTFPMQLPTGDTAYVGYKRPCSAIANIEQPVLECPP